MAVPGDRHFKILPMRFFVEEHPILTVIICLLIGVTGSIYFALMEAKDQQKQPDFVHNGDDVLMPYSLYQDSIANDLPVLLDEHEEKLSA